MSAVSSRMRVSTGDVFEHWTVLEDGVGGNTKIACRCECGTERGVQMRHLLNGRSRSCGCMKMGQRPSRKSPQPDRVEARHWRLDDRLRRIDRDIYADWREHEAA